MTILKGQFYREVAAVGTCEDCEGCCYQTPPMYGCGNYAAPVMVIAQNPGRIKREDTERFEATAAFKNLKERAIRVKSEKTLTTLGRQMFEWYQWDFGTSHGAKQLGDLLGENWLDSKRFFYTNSVRCRTLNNARPEEQMLEECTFHTKTLLLAARRRALILIGSLAREQITSFSDLDTELRSGIIQDITIDLGMKQQEMKCLPLPHYRIWRKNSITYNTYKVAVSKLLEES